MSARESSSGEREGWRARVRLGVVALMVMGVGLIGCKDRPDLDDKVLFAVTFAESGAVTPVTHVRMSWQVPQPITVNWEVAKHGDPGADGMFFQLQLEPADPAPKETVFQAVSASGHVVGLGHAMVDLRVSSLVSVTLRVVPAACDGDGDGFLASSCLQGPEASMVVVDLDDDDGTVYPEAPELCDEKDNDGDGEADEGCGPCTPDATETCGTNVGLCSEGLSTCDDTGNWGPCVGEVAPDSEICDGLDNDCDGVIDPECDCISGDEALCGTDTGACREGTKTCVRGSWGPCEGAVVAQEEVCDGVDNNCDGTIDEGCVCVVGDTQACGDVTGECEAGNQICVEGGVWGPCEGGVGPSPEICDGLDNNCDGFSDETLDICDDADLCTQDTCQSDDGCVHEQVDCPDGDSCHVATCEPTSGCSLVSVVCLDDNDPCTDTGCDVQSGCFQAPKDCEDGASCTDDTCVDGACEHAPIIGSCFIQGECYEHGDLAEVEDCWICNAVEQPYLWWPASGVDCEDGDPCTANDTCLAGTCEGEVYDCDDGIPCTFDACTGDGDCVHIPEDCEDADFDSYPVGVDCDDSSPWTYPGAPERCDGQDNDCDTIVDELGACSPTRGRALGGLHLDSDPTGTFVKAGGELQPMHLFGNPIANIGDLNKDGFDDLVVGAATDGLKLQLLFMASGGQVKEVVKIPFPGSVIPSDGFGTSVIGLGDRDGDGVQDIAVGASTFDVPGGKQSGAIFILYMNADGSVKNTKKFENEWSLSPEYMGISLALVGDLDGDGHSDLAVGVGADEGGKGKVYLFSLSLKEQYLPLIGVVSGVTELFGYAIAGIGDLDSNGVADLAVADPTLQQVTLYFLEFGAKVIGTQIIDASAGAFKQAGANTNWSTFGRSLAAIGDVDRDGIPDLAIGAPDLDNDAGAVYVLLLRADGTVKTAQELSARQGGLAAAGLAPQAPSWFGAAVAPVGDLNVDGVPDLAIGAPLHDGATQGGVFIVTLAPHFLAAGTVKTAQKLLVGGTQSNDYFGTSLAALGDVDGDGTPDLAVGAPGDDDNKENSGAVYLLNLTPGAGYSDAAKLSNAAPSFVSPIQPDGELAKEGAFGSAISLLSRPGDNVLQLLVGGPNTSATSYQGGAVYHATLDPWTLDGYGYILPDAPEQYQSIVTYNHLGASIATLGDLDGSGATAFAVSAEGDQAVPDVPGAVYIYTMAPDTGVVKVIQKIDMAKGGLVETGIWWWEDGAFGASVASIGDLNGDGVVDLAVGIRDQDVFLLFLNPDGSVKSLKSMVTSFTELGLNVPKDWKVGSSLGNLGDLDGDGRFELAVGLPEIDSVMVLAFHKDGSLKWSDLISAGQDELKDYVTPGVQGAKFGRSVTRVGDLDGSGRTTIAIGASEESEQGAHVGAVFLLGLEKLVPGESGYTPFRIRPLHFPYVLKNDTTAAKVGVLGLPAADHKYVLYELTAPATGNYTITCEGLSGWQGDGLVVVYGSPGTDLDPNQDEVQNQVSTVFGETLSVPLGYGARVYIVVGGASAESFGPFSLTLDLNTL